MELREGAVSDGMKLRRAFELYGVDFRSFVSRFPRYSRYWDSAVWELSGGEIRLAELYMVLMSESPFYILDEPFSQVDPKSIEAVQRLIKERSAGHGIIVTDHNYAAIISVTDDLFLIADGYTFQVKDRDDLVRLGYLHA